MKITRRGALIGTGIGAGAAAAGAGGVALALKDKPEPAAPPLADDKGHLVWRNWSGIHHSYPATRLAPQSEGELAAALKTTASPIRCVGAGHSFMPLVPTDGTLVSLDALAGVTKVEGSEATVMAGTRLGALGPMLASHGRAMANLPDINKQSLGGALGTATHGTGKTLRAVHGDVTWLRLAKVSGEIVECDRNNNPDLFHAARVSLGTLGVITQARIQTIPNRRIHRRVWLSDLDDAIAHAEEHWNAHRNFEFYAVPFTGLAANIAHDETDEAAVPRGPDRDTEFLELLRDLRNLLGFSTGFRKAVAHWLLSTIESEPETAIDEGWKLLSTERPVRFNEMEFHLPAEVQLKALREVVGAIEANRSDIFFPIETRRIAPDDAWLSPFQGGEHGSVAVHCYYKDEYEFLFTLIEPIFRKYGGRPHWGKLNSLKGTDFAALYPRWKDFSALRREMDPDGRFLNAYLKGLFLT
jgi:FAD-linked oxidoreductase